MINDCVDFQIVEDKMRCYITYNGKKRILSSNYVKPLFKVLSENKYPFKEILVNGIETLRYYDVEKNLFKELVNNSRVINKKVKRVNKYANKSIEVKPLLFAFLLCSSIIGYSVINKNNISDLKVDDHEIINDLELANNDINEIIDSGKIEITNNELIGKSILTDILELNNVFTFDYEDRSQCEKASTTRELYSDVITKYANMYGLPSNLMIAIATQESGIHRTEVSPGGGAGLFQIQVENGWGWLGKNIKAYNFETNQMEEITIGGEFGDKNMLLDLEYNIKVASMIMAYDLAYCDYDIIAALQTYNSGTKVSVLKDEYGNNWTEYRDSLAGDKEYIEHVLSFLPKEDRVLEYKDANGKEYSLQINNTYVSEFAHQK